MLKCLTQNLKKMVRIINFKKEKQRMAKFFVLELQGGIEM
jgi:hypothetical protein